MKYTGSLSKTIAQRRLGGLAGEDAYRDEANRTDCEMLSKLPALFKAHQVLEGDWMALAMALARVHVPGFKLSQPAGPKTKWSLIEKAEFRLAVEAVIAESGLSVNDSIEEVRKTDAWIEKCRRVSTEALEQHYYLADSEFVQAAKNARAWTALHEAE